MKTNRFHNTSLGDAKENGGGAARLSPPRSPRVARTGANRCETPPSATSGVRRAKAPAKVSTVTAKIDVGFGNALYIRGEGAGLSWDKGQPMVCVDGSTWVWSSRTGNEAVTFKLLLNDLTWCHGENLQVAAGQESQVTPEFF